MFTYPQTLKLLRDQKALENAQKVVQPLTNEGYERLEFESAKTITEEISKEDATAIAFLNVSSVEQAELDQPQTITAWVSVYSPVYDQKAPNWRFKFGDAHEYMDIRETSIAQMAIKRGGAMVDDAYKVKLEIVQEHATKGISNHYKIKEVLEFKPARLPHQADAFENDPPEPEEPNSETY